MANKRFIDFRIDSTPGSGSYLVGHDSAGTEFRIAVSNLLAGMVIPEVPTLKVQWSANGSTWTDQWSESSHYIRVKVGSAAWSGAMRIALDELEPSVILMVEKTYAELALLKMNGQLVPGQKYRITDYLTTTNDGYTYEESQARGTVEYRSVGHPFDLIVTAVLATEFDHRAVAVHSERDDDGYFAGKNLQKWQIWYDFDGGMKYGWSNSRILSDYYRHIASDVPDAAHPYAWKSRSYGTLCYTNTINPAATDKYWSSATDSGTGSVIGSGSVYEHYGDIYRMIDENGNDCPYDFKNIQFKRYVIEEATKYAKGYCLDEYIVAKLNREEISMDYDDSQWMYTFSAVKDVDGENYEYLDASMLADYDIPQLGSLPKQRNQIYGNVINPYTLTWLNYPTEEYVLLNNIVLINRIERTYSSNWGDYYYKGFNCYSNVFGNNCYEMTLGHNCTSNRFGASCYCNLIGDSCYVNTFDDFFFTNRVSSSSYYNYFGKRVSGRLVDGWTNTALAQGRMFKAVFTPATERHPFDVNYCLEYSDGVILTCDKRIEDIIYAIGLGASVEGEVADFSALTKDGYYYDGAFYSNSGHTTLMSGNKKFIYIDKTAGENNASYRYISGHYEEFVWGEGGGYTGYYNSSNGKFYEEDTFETEMTPEENSVYQDLATEKYYAWIAAGYIRCQIEDFFVNEGRIRICDVSVKGSTQVKLQRLNTNNELTFSGLLTENLGEMIDLWSIGLSQNKYEYQANKVQSISKSSADLYPSVAAVMAYVQGNP